MTFYNAGFFHNLPEAIRSKSFSRLLIAGLCILGVSLLLWVRNGLGANNGWVVPSRHSSGHRPTMDDVLVVFRTGATEALDKVPVHFDTTLSRVPHYLLVSDMEEDIAGHHLYDVLADVDDEIKKTHPDFAIYNRLQAQGRAAFSDEEIASWPGREKGNTGNMDNPGWRLDKWKFLPMIDKALEHQPSARWFVFMEADTYISWPNLLHWLEYYDPSEPICIGRTLMAGSISFSHGGSGVIMSAPAMRSISQMHADRRQELDRYTAEEAWAGDVTVGKVLAEADVLLFNGQVNLLGERPSEINYAGEHSGKPIWCYHAVSFHHLRPEDVRKLWHVEEDLVHQGIHYPRFGDVFNTQIFPQLQPVLEEWDNLSDGLSAEGYDSADDSFEDCRNACESMTSCMQFSHFPGTCRLSAAIKLGDKRAENSPPGIQSGWIIHRINDFARRTELSCGKN